MLRTFTRFFNLNFVLYTLYFISLFNLLSWSFHCVQAAPVHVSVGPEEREIGVSSKAPGHRLATIAGQINAFKKSNGLHRVARDSGLDDNIISTSDVSTATSVLFTSTRATAIPSSPSPLTLDSSMSIPWTSSSTTSSCMPVVSSSSFRLETGGSFVGGSDGPTSSPIPAWTSPVTPPASSVTAPSFPPTVPPSVATAETDYPLSSPVLKGPSPSTPSASQETFPVTGLSLTSGVLPSVATIISDCPSSLSIPAGPSAVTPPASSDILPPTTPPAVLPSVTPVVTSPPSILSTTEGLPPVMPPASSETPIVSSLPPPVPPVFTSLPPPIVALSSSPVVPAASSVTTTSQSAASPATATSPDGRPTSTTIVSVTPVTPEPSPATTSTSSAPNAQSNSSSQQASSSPTSSPSSESNAASSSQLSGPLIAIITVLSFLGIFSLVLGIIVFFRTRRRRIAQTRQPSPPNLSSRFSVSTTGSMEQSRRFTLFNSRPLTTRSLLPRPTNPNDGVTSATTPLVYFQGHPDDSLETESRGPLEWL